MPEQNVATGVARASDQGFDNDSVLSSPTSPDRREEEGNNRWPVSLQYPLHERFGVSQGDHAVATKNSKVGVDF